MSRACCVEIPRIFTQSERGRASRRNMKRNIFKLQDHRAVGSSRVTAISVTLGALAVAVIPAQASSYYLTDDPTGADVWVIEAPASVPGAVDCWIWSGDITSAPDITATWLYVTDNAKAADKWIMISDVVGARDDASCLLGE